MSRWQIAVLALGWAWALTAKDAAPLPAPPAGRSWVNWRSACAALPSNRALRGNPVPAQLLPLPHYEEFSGAVAEFIQQCKSGLLGNTNLWVGELLPSVDGFFNTDTAYFLNPATPTTALIQGFLQDDHPALSRAAIPYQPFAQKVQLPAGAEVFLHADLHGDIRSLLADVDWLNEHGYLQGFRIVRPQFYLAFTGDYADRGRYGVEVWYTLLRLKLTNPDQVFLARGNHEEVSLAARYGFLSEGRVKYGAAFDPKKVLRAFDFLPAVLYLGTAGNFIQVQHGGLEPGFDPRPLLDAPGTCRFQFLGTLNQRRFLAAHPDCFPAVDRASRQAFDQHALDFRPVDPLSPTVLGFMWNDFTLVTGEREFAWDPGRAFVYGQWTTQCLLAQTQTPSNAVRAIFRGHQQSSAINPMMRRLVASRGIFRHWQPGDSAARLGAELGELEQILERAPERPIPAGSVWTLNISPDSVYGQACGFTFDTFGLVKTAPRLAEWRLRVINIDINF